jgi:hypothetical protein
LAVATPHAASAAIDFSIDMSELLRDLKLVQMILRKSDFFQSAGSCMHLYLPLPPNVPILLALTTRKATHRPGFIRADVAQHPSQQLATGSSQQRCCTDLPLWVISFIQEHEIER